MTPLFVVIAIFLAAALLTAATSGSAPVGRGLLHPGPIWTLTLLAVFGAVAIGVATLTGTLEPPTSGLTLAGSLVASSAVLAGAAASMSRHLDSRDRAQLEAAVSAADLLVQSGSSKGAEASLLIIADLGFVETALSLLGSLRDELEPATAAEVIDKGLRSSSETTQQWAADELLHWVGGLVHNLGMEWPGAVLYSWPIEMHLSARRSCFHAAVSALIETLQKGGPARHGIALQLDRIIRTDPNNSLVREAGGVLAVLLPGYRGGGIHIQGETLSYDHLAESVAIATATDAVVTHQTIDDMAKIASLVMQNPAGGGSSTSSAADESDD